MIIDLKNEVICLNFVSEKNEASREKILQFLRYRVAPTTLLQIEGIIFQANTFLYTS